ncbi:hypothetical protein Hanom_Chr13g01203311 [Helianthus anomalus]
MGVSADVFDVGFEKMNEFSYKWIYISRFAKWAWAQAHKPNSRVARYIYEAHFRTQS